MPTLSQHACFSCRKVFKKPHEYTVTPTVWVCPECGNELVAMGYKFRAPKATDVREWSRIETALREGRDYGVRTVRKVKPNPKLSPQLRMALGIYGKRKTKRMA
jgi:predicted RNA-binding Zn-ribbon protein involved in translation (DUF1610 family)